MAIQETQSESSNLLHIQPPRRVLVHMAVQETQSESSNLVHIQPPRRVLVHMAVQERENALNWSIFSHMDVFWYIWQYKKERKL
jgi:hypothetical protein